MEEQQKNTDKLTDKAFSRLMLTSVLGILICIMCLCSATWAWFSGDVANDNNKLEAGNFDLDVVVVNNTTAETLTVTERADGTKACALGEADSYTVTLTITDDTTVTKGYCVVTVNGKPYKTASVNVDGASSIIFTLDAENAEVTVHFAPTWGISAHVDVENGGTLTVDAAAAPAA